MKKIKIFSGGDPTKLQELVNEFLKQRPGDRQNVQFTTCQVGNMPFYSVLVEYSN